jgi:hypothetical protein
MQVGSSVMALQAAQTVYRLSQANQQLQQITMQQIQQADVHIQTAKGRVVNQAIDTMVAGVAIKGTMIDVMA